MISPEFYYTESDNGFYDIFRHNPPMKVVWEMDTELEAEQLVSQLNLIDPDDELIISDTIVEFLL